MAEGVRAVPLPCDLDSWSRLRDHLSWIRDNSPTSSICLLRGLDLLQRLANLPEFEVPSDPSCHFVKRSCFEGLARYLEEVASEEEKKTFLKVTLPYIVEKALEIERVRPTGLLHYLAQNENKEVELSRPFVTSLIACSFLCILPEPATERRFKLNDINFKRFFACLNKSRPGQTGKLRCILHYFSKLRECEERAADTETTSPSSSSSGPDPHTSSSLSSDWPRASLTLALSVDRLLPQQQPVLRVCRRVMQADEVLTSQQLLSLSRSLIFLQVDSVRRVEQTDQRLMRVDFANTYLGGGVLGAGCAQEEITFCTHPELLASMIFTENMEDNEAIWVEGHRPFSSVSGYRTTFRWRGDSGESTNVAPRLCAVDALPFNYCAEEQFCERSILREINKAYAGFHQLESNATPEDHECCCDKARESYKHKVLQRRLNLFYDEAAASVIEDAILECSFRRSQNLRHRSADFGMLPSRHRSSSSFSSSSLSRVSSSRSGSLHTSTSTVSSRRSSGSRRSSDLSALGVVGPLTSASGSSPSAGSSGEQGPLEHHDTIFEELEDSELTSPSEHRPTGAFALPSKTSSTDDTRKPPLLRQPPVLLSPATEFDADTARAQLAMMLQAPISDSRKLSLSRELSPNRYQEMYPCDRRRNSSPILPHLSYPRQESAGLSVTMSTLSAPSRLTQRRKSLPSELSPLRHLPLTDTVKISCKVAYYAEGGKVSKTPSPRPPVQEWPSSGISGSSTGPSSPESTPQERPYRRESVDADVLLWANRCAEEIINDSLERCNHVIAMRDVTNRTIQRVMTSAFQRCSDVLEARAKSALHPWSSTTSRALVQRAVCWSRQLSQWAGDLAEDLVGSVVQDAQHRIGQNARRTTVRPRRQAPPRQLSLTTSTSTTGASGDENLTTEPRLSTHDLRHLERELSLYSSSPSTSTSDSAFLKRMLLDDATVQRDWSLMSSRAGASRLAAPGPSLARSLSDVNPIGHRSMVRGQASSLDDAALSGSLPQGRYATPVTLTRYVDNLVSRLFNEVRPVLRDGVQAARKCAQRLTTRVLEEVKGDRRVRGALRRRRTISFEESRRISGVSGFEEAYDVPYHVVDRFAAGYTSQVLVDSILTLHENKDALPLAEKGIPMITSQCCPCLGCPKRRAAAARGQMGVATGNWGCGAFGGDPQLKSMLQWISASVAGLPIMVYCTGQERRVSKLDEIARRLIANRWTVKDLYSTIQDYCWYRARQRDDDDTGDVTLTSLFDFIMQKL